VVNESRKCFENVGRRKRQGEGEGTSLREKGSSYEVVVVYGEVGTDAQPGGAWGGGRGPFWTRVPY